MNNKLYLFDCDGTLWNSHDSDYIGSVPSGFEKITDDIILRLKDGKKFYLNHGVLDLFKTINKNSKNLIGIVSDNPPESVIEALKALGLYDYINSKAINIKLWQGYCPKHKMILEILNKPEFHNISKKNVFWFDDKNYSSEANEIGVKFVKVN